MYPHEILVERIGPNDYYFADGYEIRMIIFEVDDGCRSITDIVVVTLDFVKSWVRTFEKTYDMDPITIHSNHDHVDFGRAKTLQSRVYKIAQDLMK